MTLTFSPAPRRKPMPESASHLEVRLSGLLPRTRNALKPRAYVAGPMRGLPEYNFPAFDKAREILLGAGWEVLSPADMDRNLSHHPDKGDTLMPFKWYMARDLKAVCDSDAVFALPGWEESEGANLEIDVARRVGVPVYSFLSGRRIKKSEPLTNPVFPPVGVLSGEPVEGHRLEGVTDTYEAAFVNAHLKVAEKIDSMLDCGPKTRFKDPVTGGEKEESQARFDLVPPDAHTMVARVYGKGATKYAPNNWLRGYPWHLSIGALERHVQRFKAGEDLDVESELPHMAHVAWQAYTLLVFQLRGLGTDDRAKIGGEA